MLAIEERLYFTTLKIIAKDVSYMYYFIPEYDEPHCLVVLLEEELIVIDLESTNWPSFQNPYLNSLHSSPITCSHHVANVPSSLWQKIEDVGESQSKSYSKRVIVYIEILGFVFLKDKPD